MKRSVALAMACVVAALAVASCKRHKDPYEDWKAPQLLDEGDRLLRAGDLAAAEAVYKRGHDVAKASNFKLNDPRVFDQRRLFIAAAQENIPAAIQLYSDVGGGNDYMTMDVRIGVDLIVLLARAGKLDEARKYAERLGLRLESTQPMTDDELPLYIVGWIEIDRLRTANVEIERAKQASTAVVDLLAKAVEKAVMYQHPLNPAARAWVNKYADHLYDTERSLVAQKIADYVERIDQAAPADPDVKPCLPLQPMFPSLGCIPDWAVPAQAGSQPSR